MSTHVYRGHRIEPLTSRVCGPEECYYWLVCPDSGAPSWYACSLADAREVIDLAALGELDIEAARAEGRAPLRDHPEVESGGGLMPTPFYEADDIHDAATDAVRALNHRLERRGLQLIPEHFGPLRELIAAALPLIEVEEVAA